MGREAAVHDEDAFGGHDPLQLADETGHVDRPLVGGVAGLGFFPPLRHAGGGVREPGLAPGPARGGAVGERVGKVPQPFRRVAP